MVCMACTVMQPSTLWQGRPFWLQPLQCGTFRPHAQHLATRLTLESFPGP